ncbi:DNAJC8 (predicted) [Pycnogonum litorale]
MSNDPLNSGGGSDGDYLFDTFYCEVKQIEKRDSVFTPHQQIERLLRPGSTYFNLNPFEVLQIDPETPVENIKKQYRKLSILVHPDKNQDNKEKAEKAFEIVSKAWKNLENETTRNRALEIVEEAKARTDLMIQEKKKKLKKAGKSTDVDEDDPVKFKHAVYVLTMKLFADMERKRRQLEIRDMEERKRKREGEIEEEEKFKTEKEWQKNFEASREGRVNSWKTFKDGGKKSKKIKTTGFKPPKHKAEQRN